MVEGMLAYLHCVLVFLCGGKIRSDQLELMMGFNLGQDGKPTSCLYD